MDKINEINEKIIKRQEESIELLKSLLKTKDIIIDELKEQLRIGAVSVSLLERAAALVGNPATNISGSTDLACEEWQKDYESWRNER